MALLVLALSCADHVPPVLQAAGEAVQAGRLDRAGDLLTGALALCPDHPGLLAELAGLRFRQGRYDEAEVLAVRLTRADPSSELGWQLLGTLRYLRDDPLRALAAWSRGRPPVVRTVEIPVFGPGGERPTAGGPDPAQLTGLAPGEPLTIHDLVRARRRLATLPAAERTRLDYRMLPGGEAAVGGAVTLRARWPVHRAAWPIHVLRAAAGGLRLQAADPLERLELWEVAGAREGRLVRAHAAVEHLAPGPDQGSTGTWRWEVEHRSGRYGLSPDEVIREEGTRAWWTHAHWLTATLRATVGPGVEVRRGQGTFGGAYLEGMLVPLGSWGSLAAAAERWWKVSRTAEGFDRYGRLDVEARLHPSVTWHGSTNVEARAGVTTVSLGSPLGLAPRVGKGSEVGILMRARSDLDGDGVVRPLYPGRAWLHGGVEVSRTLTRLGVADVGGALFADGVRVLSRGDAGAAAARAGARSNGIHLGGGLRLGVPGGTGRLRLDLAVDLADGHTGLSVGWVPAHPWNR